MKTARTDVDATRGFVLTTHVGLEARARADLRALGLDAATFEGHEDELDSREATPVVWSIACHQAPI